MILTNDEMQQVRQSIETQAGLDGDLMQRCGHLIHMGAFDEAVRSAFVLLEERLRKVVDKDGLTGTALANSAFSEDGSLGKLLAHSKSEQQGLRELYSGAFRLFRNPTAHGVIGYSAAEGKAIIELVNLMLIILDRAGDIPPEGILPANVKIALDKIEKSVGAGAASRLRVFLAKCIGDLALKTSPVGRQRIPFKRYAFGNFGARKRPKPHFMPVFYLQAFDGPQPVLQFPMSFYTCIDEFDLDSLVDNLKELGFQLVGKEQNPTVALPTHNGQAFFDDLFDLLQQTVAELAATLPRE